MHSSRVAGQVQTGRCMGAHSVVPTDCLRAPVKVEAQRKLPRVGVLSLKPRAAPLGDKVTDQMTLEPRNLICFKSQTRSS